MSWNHLAEDVRSAASDALTEKQLAALKLELAGLSVRAIGRHLGIARQAAVDRLEAAHMNLLRAGVRQDELGRWSVSPPTAEEVV